jgi:hypothetical protein
MTESESVVVALAAALAGPSRPAVATRRTVRDGLGRARRQDLGPFVELFGRPPLAGDSAGTEMQPTSADPAAPSPTAATDMDHSAVATPATHGPSE